MRNHICTGLLAAMLAAPSYGFAKNTPEQVRPVTMDILTVTDTGLGIVELHNLEESQIRQIQRALAEKNLYDGPIDGIWGNHTTNAVERFQKSYGLWAEGLVTTSTLAQLGVPVDIYSLSPESIAPAAGNRP